MAVKASASITISRMADVQSVTRYYLKRSSTAAAPGKPTTATPSGWSTTEPTYNQNATETLYIVDKTTLSDGTFSYSNVSVSSSFEAAKQAYSQAMAAASAASTANTNANNAASAASAAQTTANTANSTANAAKTKIDNLKVGGRNLIVNSAEPKGHTGTGGTNQCTNLYAFSPFYMANLYPQTTRASGPALQLTLSFDWSSTATSGTFVLQPNGYPYVAFSGTVTLSASNTSGHVTRTVSIAKNANYETSYSHVGIRLDNLTGTVTISNMKVEVGNVETSWSPAPEDVQSGIDAAQEIANDVDDLEERFNTEQTLTGDRFASVNASVGELKSGLSGISTDLIPRMVKVEAAAAALWSWFSEDSSNMEAFIRFINGDIILGKATAKTLLKLTAESMSFADSNGVPQLEITPGASEMTNARVLDALSIGTKQSGVADFRWVRSKTDGHMRLFL